MATRPVMLPGTVHEVLERGRKLRSYGHTSREIAQELGMAATSYTALNAVAISVTDPDEKISSAAIQEMERINATGHIDASYRRISALRKGVRVKPSDRRPRQSTGRATEAIPAAFDVLRGLILGLNSFTVEQLTTVHPETLLEWADEMGRLRSQLYGFQKKAKKAAHE